MPLAARVLQPDGLPVDVLVGKHQDLGLLGQQELVQHVELEFAEASG